jgi:hypothetical protein
MPLRHESVLLLLAGGACSWQPDQLAPAAAGAYASGNYKAYDYYNGNASTAGAATSANYQFSGSDITFCWASQACCGWPAEACDVAMPLLAAAAPRRNTEATCSRQGVPERPSKS